MRNGRLLIAFLTTLLIVVVLFGLAAAYDYYRYPNYHSIKLGMTKKEVDLIVCCSGCDDYPDNTGGCTSYYFAGEGAIIVVFNAKHMAVLKKIGSK